MFFYHTMEVADANPRLVVRNTFLELFDDEPALGPIETHRRPRAQTDLTDSKMPQKVHYQNDQEDGAVTPGGLLLHKLNGGLGALSEDSPMNSLLTGNPFLMGQPPFMVPYGGYPQHVLPGAWDYAAAASAAGGGRVPPFPCFPAPWVLPGYPGTSPGGSAFAQPAAGNRGDRKARATAEGGVPLAATTACAGAPAFLTKGGERSERGERMPATAAASLLLGQQRQTIGSAGAAGAPRGALAEARATLTAAHAAAGTPAASPSRQGDNQGPPGDVLVCEDHTTVMLRNIPIRYTQTMLLTLLGEHGFAQSYDFVYLPMDFRNGVNLGYAFVNLLLHQDAAEVMEIFHGFSSWYLDSSKICEVTWAHPHQGLAEHVERYRNSPVMHSSMPDEYKPMVFKNGMRLAFPVSTKAIRAPKLRPVRERERGQEAQP